MSPFSLRIKFLYWKYVAKSNYIRYNNACEEYSCGCAMAEVISPRVYKAKVKFNAAMDKLAKLDPSTPEHRL